MLLLTLKMKMIEENTSHFSPRSPDLPRKQMNRLMQLLQSMLTCNGITVPSISIAVTMQESSTRWAAWNVAQKISSENLKKSTVWIRMHQITITLQVNVTLIVGFVSVKDLEVHSNMRSIPVRWDYVLRRSARSTRCDSPLMRRGISFEASAQWMMLLSLTKLGQPQCSSKQWIRRVQHRKVMRILASWSIWKSPIRVQLYTRRGASPRSFTSQARRSATGMEARLGRGVKIVANQRSQSRLVMETSCVVNALSTMHLDAPAARLGRSHACRVPSLSYRL